MGSAFNSLICSVFLSLVPLFFACSRSTAPPEFISIINLTFAADGRRVAFVGYERNCRKSIFLLDLETGRFDRLVDGTEFDWTRDGTTLVVTDPHGMFLFDPAQHRKKELLPVQYPYFFHYVRCSPATDEVLFVSSFCDNNPEIYKVNYRDLKRYRLTENKVEDSYPSWSPDGSRIAYLSNNMPYVMDADGNNKIVLLEKLADARPAWAPDSKRLALTMLVARKAGPFDGPFTFDAKGNIILQKKDFVSTIFLIATDGSRFSEISEGADPRWNFSGDKFSLWFPPGVLEPKLYVYSQVTQKFTQLLDKMQDSTYTITAATWFPKTDQLLFVAGNDKSLPNGICQINADNTGYRRICSF